MTQRLTGKVAIVTGGGRGVGRAICLRLAAEGATVAVFDMDLQTATAVAAEIRDAGGQARAYQVDVTDYPRLKAVAAQAIADFTQLDILVNCAGWDKIEPFLQSEESTWDKVLAINLRGPITLTRAVLDHMIARGQGRIISIASDAGRVGSLFEVVYSGAKAGLIGFSKALAREMAKKGITVNCVCPGPTNTPLLAEINAYAPKIVGALEKAVPMGRLGRPEDIAAGVAFLASDEACYITGQSLSISGGLTMI